MNENIGLKIRLLLDDENVNNIYEKFL